MIKNNNHIHRLSAFTLVEIMMGVLIFSLVIIGGFKAYSGVLVGKIKLIESTDIQKEAFYFSEKFFEEIKKGGTIDYEEYFNRTVVGTGVTNGHYDTQSGFGNNGITYLCRSNDGLLMPGNGCVSDFNDALADQSGTPQRFGQYALQFIDYNSNYDADLGNEDEGIDGNIIGDDDDEYLGEGPEAFTGSKVEEIYLMSADKKSRTLFRWSVTQDPDEPGGLTCLNTDIVNNTWSGGCLGNIEFLKLEGKDWGSDHDTTGDGTYDGIIDTWLIGKDFSGMTNATPATSTIAGSSATSDNWQPLFSDDINVSDVEFFAYPNKDLELAWKDASEEVNIAPYIRIQMTLSPSYQARKGIKGNIPEININTTISLTDIYSR